LFLASEHLNSQHNSIEMLHSRIMLLLNYVKAVQNGDLPSDHEILRATHALCRRLPVLSSEKLKEDLHDVRSVVLFLLFYACVLYTCGASITRSTGATIINELKAT